MLELVLALVCIPVVFGLAMMLMGFAGFAVYAPFLAFDRLLDRLWGVRHPEPPTVVYMQPPAAPPTYPAPMPPAQQPVVHNHHYYLLGQQPPAPPLPAPTLPRTSNVVEGEWREVRPSAPRASSLAPVQGRDEVRRLLAAGRPARRLTRGD